MGAHSPSCDLHLARSSLQPAKGGQAEDEGTRSAKPRAGDGVPAPQVGREGLTEEQGRLRSGKDLGVTPAGTACGSCSLLVPAKRLSSGRHLREAGKTASRDGCFLTPGMRAAF